MRDTRTLPAANAPQRIPDAVAHLRDPVDGSPWGLIVEFKTKPELNTLGQTLAYQAQVFSSEKPDLESGSRFWVTTVIVNLTGQQAPYLQKHYQGVSLASPTPPLIVNVENQVAESVLARIEHGELGLATLGWIPLMRGGADTDIIARWVRLAKQEIDLRRRSDYATLALVFAAVAERSNVWQVALEGWNVEENSQVKLWQEQALKKGEKLGQKKGEAIGLQKGTLIGKIQLLQSLLGEAVTTESALRSRSLKRLQEQQTDLHQRFTNRTQTSTP